MVGAKKMEHDVYARLERLHVHWKKYDHPPVFTVEEAEQHWAAIPATHCKNLFLRNRKGTTHYLVIAEHSKRVDLNSLAARIGEDRLSFGSPERLLAHLGLTPGAVSPFGLIHPGAAGVRVIIDVALRDAATVAFHPNVNTATITVSVADFQRFLADCGNIVRYVAL